MVVKEISHKNKPQKTLSTKEIKLEKLNNIDKKVNYFNYNYLDRYINYKKKNNNLSDKQIVLNVNMNLDYKFYEKIIPSKYLNKEYILVNKYYYVGEKYVPENLESLPLSYSRSGMKLTNVAKSALEELINAAKKDNMTILVTSSYRSYEYQVKLYNQYAEENSKEEADTYSARPGYSEHQTGLAVDIHNGKKVYTDFENTEEFNWMQENAYKYGFILRFPKDKVNETGYIYESWHYRYVGKDIAKYIHKNNISFEEYYAQFIENKK
jgi:D-alanyl-D-alanine carboxypeptidase